MNEATAALFDEAYDLERIFTAALVDEPGQATEPGTVIAYSRVEHGGRGVLVGDPQQLPPTVMNPSCVAGGLTVILLERLMELPGLKPVVLNMQYRMAPSLMWFSNRQFYRSAIRNARSTFQQKPPNLINWNPNFAGVFFYT